MGLLFPAKWNDNLFVAASENYPAIFNSFDRDLVNLGTDLETKLLAFAHRFAIDNRKAGSAIERDRGDNESACRNFALVRSAAGYFSGRFPTNWPERTADSAVDVE